MGKKLVQPSGPTVVFKATSDDDVDVRMSLDELIRKSNKAAAAAAVHRERQSKARARAEGAKKAAKALADANEQRVEEAYRRLTPTQRGRSATALIASATGLSDDTVRAHLKVIRARPKPE